jgi:hypothetical protein
MAIHGGFPDEGHFAVALAILNFPYMELLVLDNSFTAFAGDKYSNPVRPGNNSIL